MGGIIDTVSLFIYNKFFILVLIERENVILWN